jgi:hypothetical protein
VHQRTCRHRPELGAQLADVEDAAAGDVEDLAVDPAGVVGGEEGDDVPDVVRPADLAPDALGGCPCRGRRVGEPVVRVKMLIAPLAMVYMVAIGLAM